MSLMADAMQRVHADETSATSVRIDGKHFALGSHRFPFRGVTYGTFRAREDGALFPERELAKLDFAAIADAGFSVLRTYTTPPDDLLDLAADWGLWLMPDVFYLDWRYLVGASRRQMARVAADARNAVRAEARRLASSEQVLALSLGNEIPADVLRWVGTRHVARVIDDLADVVREEDPHRLVTYANYPTAEYLPLDGLDFLTFNVFLENQRDFRRYLTHLQHVAGDRPLVLGEVGMDAGDAPDGEARQAEVVDWQLSIALERGVAGTCLFSWTDEWWVGNKPVEGWRFGLTRDDRSPRPALSIAARWNDKTVRDLSTQWPRLSVVICAHNAEDTLDECLRHTCALDYPNLDIVVVDDGSTDATGAIAARHHRARGVTIPHSGLGAARNEGLKAATGELIAYLDADAYPPPEWPYYLVLGLDGRDVAGVGGPNVPPPEDPLGAQVVARAPGGPVQVLLTDDRAEHIPGCNMAFWRYALERVGGCDPVYTAAGDDVDLCWKILDQDWQIGFHPAAVVWHHRRGGLRAYLRQQRGYGRAEALVEARHPDRFGAVGTARWRGRIYTSLGGPAGRQRVYRGPLGTAAYQSIYRDGGHALDLVHQVGVRVAAAALLSAPLAAVAPPLGLPAAVSALLLAALFVIDTASVRPPRELRRRRLMFRAAVGLHQLLQPLVRWRGRQREARVAHRDVAPRGGVRCVGRAPRGTLLFPNNGSRTDLSDTVAASIRAGGTRTVSASEWDDHDAHLLASWLLRGELVTSGYPAGCVQLRVRRRLVAGRVALAAIASAALIAISPPAGAVALGVAAADVVRGWWRTGPGVRRALERRT